jgi:ABC-type branched-subunit amino acid transport system substrate-binding protein
MKRMNRREVLGGIAGTGLTLMAQQAVAASPELTVALLAPLSGPWAQQGHLMLLGAKMAMTSTPRAA